MSVRTTLLRAGLALALVTVATTPAFACGGFDVGTSTTTAQSPPPPPPPPPPPRPRTPSNACACVRG